MNHMSSDTQCHNHHQVIHILFKSIFDFDFTIVISLQTSGVSSKDGSATKTSVSKQLHIDTVKAAGDPNTPALGNAAGTIACMGGH